MESKPDTDPFSSTSVTDSETKDDVEVKTDSESKSGDESLRCLICFEEATISEPILRCARQTCSKPMHFKCLQTWVYGTGSRKCPHCTYDPALPGLKLRGDVVTEIFDMGGGRDLSQPVVFGSASPVRDHIEEQLDQVNPIQAAGIRETVLEMVGVIMDDRPLLDETVARELAWRSIRVDNLLLSFQDARDRYHSEFRNASRNLNERVEDLARRICLVNNSYTMETARGVATTLYTSDHYVSEEYARDWVLNNIEPYQEGSGWSHHTSEDDGDAWEVGPEVPADESEEKKEQGYIGAPAQGALDGDGEPVPMLPDLTEVVYDEPMGPQAPYRPDYDGPFSDLLAPEERMEVNPNALLYNYMKKKCEYKCYGDHVQIDCRGVSFLTDAYTPIWTRDVVGTFKIWDGTGKVSRASNCLTFLIVEGNQPDVHPRRSFLPVPKEYLGRVLGVVGDARVETAALDMIPRMADAKGVDMVRLHNLVVTQYKRHSDPFPQLDSLVAKVLTS